MAVGTHDRDLALAVNKVIEMQGGIAVAAGGAVRSAVPFRIGGFLSEGAMEEIAAGMNDFQKELLLLGSPFEHPHLTLMVLTSSAIPFIRMTEKGYYRFREGDYVGL
jgi:adenine deaminase